ncbi:MULTISPECIES: acyl-CoA-binding protein [Luteimonas]|uniref:acyl-CoA-binding protein n=1 Tax=Luteimonas TaxID=83614 RepID=UPI000C7D7871|nr:MULTISPECIES: acyl-CoA-binding protein [Luteimonas]
MPDLTQQFEAAGRRVRDLPARPDNDTLLRLYALYKQATEGDAGGPRPGFFDFVGTAKREAWERLAGTSRETAMQRYIDLVATLVA